MDRLWAAIPSPAAVTVVLEPTRNAWVPLAAWFRRHGAGHPGPPEQSAHLRDYYSKHAKFDHLDSRMLARLPLLPPEGLRPAEGLGPADALRRATKLRASLVKRRNTILARLDSYLELLGPKARRIQRGPVNAPPAAPLIETGRTRTARPRGRQAGRTSALLATIIIVFERGVTPAMAR